MKQVGTILSMMITENIFILHLKIPVCDYIANTEYKGQKEEDIF